MPKAGDLDWGNLFKSEEEPTTLRKSNEHVPGAQHNTVMNHKVNERPATPVNKPGEVPRRPSNDEVASFILGGMNDARYRQATDEELFGGLVKSQEELDAMDKDWENTLNKWHESAAAPIEDQSALENKEWGSEIKSFNDSLTEEELQKRNMYVNRNE